MITTAMGSERGGREVNEDRAMALQNENACLCVVADGLGGHGAGEVASAIVVEVARDLFPQEPQPDDLLAHCLDTAQERLLEEQQKRGRKHDIKTTAVLLWLKEDTAQWAHIGDSRLYLFHGTKLMRRTLDHSVPQMLVQQGELREKEIRFHEDRNRLLRVLGEPWEAPRYVLSDPVPLKPSMTFLLCSDGFWEWMGEARMAHLLGRSKTPEAWLCAMKEEILQSAQGKPMDNYSAVVVFVR